MSIKNRIEELRLAGRLPSPNGVALAIMDICRREDSTLEEVIRVVQADPALSSRLLHLANAARNSGRAVASIHDAVMCLGKNSVRQLAMGFSLVDQYNDPSGKGFDYQTFWSHSLLMALASQNLAEVARLGTPDELFVCGLLARIGRLALVTLYPEQYPEILAQAAEGETLLLEERLRLETDHNELTGVILADCGLPKALVEPLSHHELPEQSHFAEGSRPYQLTQLFFLARRMADLGRAEEAERHNKIAELMRLGSLLGLNAEGFGEMFDRTVEQWRQWSTLLNIEAPQVPSFLAMVKARAPRPADEAKPNCKRVLLVEDEPTSMLIAKTALEQVLGCTVTTAGNGKEGLMRAPELLPQIILTDWIMPEMDGVNFCRALRATEWGQPMYVIMLTSVEDEEKITEAFEAGVDDYVTKPINTRSLKARMRAAMHYVNLLETWEHDRAQLKKFATDLAVSNRRLEHAAMTDLLTGIPNRRAGMDALAKSWNAAQRSGKPMSVLMLDVDFFKQVNDRHGHAIGDRVLQEVANAIQNAARKDDSVSRYGGEEFLLVCHDAPPKTAALAAERLRALVQGLQLDIEGVRISVTASIGVATREADMADPGALVQAADAALYAAKNAGRNRVCVNLDGKNHFLPERG